MYKITPKIQKKIAKNTLGRSMRKQWNSGASFRVSMDWDADKHIISAEEVKQAVINHLNKSTALRKLKVLSINISTDYVR